MATQVIMPQLGESVVEGTVSRWLKGVGDTVNEYDPLLEVSTDKVDTEVPAPASGTILEIYVAEGETVQAGTIVCMIGEAGEVIAEKPKRTQGHSVQQESVSGVNGSKSVKSDKREQGPRISPVVARMLAEYNLDIHQISGTGRDGRVTKKDVEAYLESQATGLAPWEQPGSGDLFKPTEAPPDSMLAQKPATAPVASPPAKRAIPAEPIPQGAPGELVQLSNMRRRIAEHMVQSKLHIAPHVTTVFEVDMSQVLAHRAKHKESFAKQGINLTLTAYFVQAMVVASQAQPVINSQWQDDGVYLHHHVNVAMAVALDDGLIVPVIKNAEELNLAGLARRVNDLATRARNKQLQPDDMQGGTITITNHGVTGSIVATPIINQPQTAIFGVGIMEKRVKVINDAIAIRPCCYISLTFDHRVADGAVADSWMMALKNTLENWPVE